MIWSSCSNNNMWKTIAIISLCSAGLVYQTWNVGERYAEYRTKTLINMKTQSKVDYPSISLCFRYHDMLDREKVSKSKNIRLGRWDDVKFDAMKFFKSTVNFSISEIYEYTPSENHILRNGIGCSIRYTGRYRMDNINTSNCYKIFRIEKYLAREFVCFRLIPRIAEKLTIGEANLCPSHVGVLYRIYLNSKIFKNMYGMSIMIHSNRSNIMYDTLFSSNTLLIMKTMPKAFVFHREFERLRMVKPYDTSCTPFPDSDSVRSWNERRYDAINSLSMSKWNFSTPFHLTFNSSLNVRKVLDYRTFQEFPDYREWLADIMERYFSNRKVTCFTNYFGTRSQIHQEMRPEFSIQWTQDEKTIITHAPEQELIDFIVYICSCIGTWFGISAYSAINTFRTIVSKGPPEKRRINSIENLLRDQIRESESMRYDMIRMRRHLIRIQSRL